MNISLTPMYQTMIDDTDKNKTKVKSVKLEKIFDIEIVMFWMKRGIILNPE